MVRGDAQEGRGCHRRRSRTRRRRSSPRRHLRPPGRHQRSLGGAKRTRCSTNPANTDVPRPGTAHNRYGVEEGALRTGEGSKGVSEPESGARQRHCGASLVAIPPDRAPNTLFDVSPVEAAPSSAPHRSRGGGLRRSHRLAPGSASTAMAELGGAVIGGGRGLRGVGRCLGVVLVCWCSWARLALRFRVQGWRLRGKGQGGAGSQRLGRVG